MNKLAAVVVAPVVSIFLLSYSAFAGNDGRAGRAPVEPFIYSCDSYKSDSAIDPVSANTKAKETIGREFNYISDAVAYSLYLKFSRDKRLISPFEEALRVHRDRKNNMLTAIILEAMSKQGTTKFIVDMCTRKGASVNEIASSFPVAYDETMSANRLD